LLCIPCRQKRSHLKQPVPLDTESYSSTTPNSQDQVIQQTCRLVSFANRSFSREVDGLIQAIDFERPEGKDCYLGHLTSYILVSMADVCFGLMWHGNADIADKVCVIIVIVLRNEATSSGVAPAKSERFWAYNSELSSWWTVLFARRSAVLDPVYQRNNVDFITKIPPAAPCSLRQYFILGLESEHGNNNFLYISRNADQ
jgi:hypothetical protein